MQRSSFPWIWVALAATLLLLPGTLGRLLLQLLGGLTLVVILLPVLTAGVGFLAWQLLRRRLTPCPNCGMTSIGSEVCPGCGSVSTADPSQVTINVESVDVETSPKGPSP